MFLATVPHGELLVQGAEKDAGEAGTPHHGGGA
jgi:hypothetical protein